MSRRWSVLLLPEICQEIKELRPWRNNKAVRVPLFHWHLMDCWCSEKLPINYDPLQRSCPFVPSSSVWGGRLSETGPSQWWCPNTGIPFLLTHSISPPLNCATIISACSVFKMCLHSIYCWLLFLLLLFPCLNYCYCWVLRGHSDRYLFYCQMQCFIDKLFYFWCGIFACRHMGFFSGTWNNYICEVFPVFFQEISRVSAIFFDRKVTTVTCIEAGVGLCK